MSTFTTESFTAALALVGIVIIVSSLLSGAVERSGVPQVAIFLLLGVVVGPAGLGLVELSLASPSLRVIATLGLVLVLFSDAIAMDIAEVRRHRRLALLVLGPGTLIPAALIALAAWWLLGLAPAAAAVLGAALASTDPVLLRSLLRSQALPATTRLALRLESGMNDVVLLPMVLLAMLALPVGEGGHASHSPARLVVGLFLLGPGAGALVGWAAITLLDRIRKQVGVRRDYESLYALGVALTAYAIAEFAGGSGFLAAFAAGLTIAALDVELCDCFLDYGEATAEMFLLLTFVAFGASLIWMGLDVLDAPTLAFAAVALGARTIVQLPVLRTSGLPTRDQRLIAWLGPRGLSTLLLVLLPVFAGVPGSERLFAVSCLVVVISVALHGGAIAIFMRRQAARGATPSPFAPDDGAPRVPAGALTPEAAPVPERITIDEMRQLRAAGEQVILLDVRTQRTYGADGTRAEGAIRLPPDDATRQAAALAIPKGATLAAYCT